MLSGHCLVLILLDTSKIFVLSVHSSIMHSIHIGDEYIKSLIANPELVDRLALTSDEKVCHSFQIHHQYSKRIIPY